MTNAPAYDLNALHDIVEPPVVALWPPEAGLVFLLLAFIVAVLALICGSLLKVRQNRYRAAAGTLLDQAETVQEVSTVLKRAALTVWPREQVAPLYGRDWAKFLSSSCPGVTFEARDFEVPGNPVSAEFRAAARLWLRDHKAPVMEGR